MARFALGEPSAPVAMFLVGSAAYTWLRAAVGLARLVGRYARERRRTRLFMPQRPRLTPSRPRPPVKTDLP